MNKNNTKVWASCWTKLPQQSQINWKVVVIFRRCVMSWRHWRCLPVELRSAAERQNDWGSRKILNNMGAYCNTQPGAWLCYLEWRHFWDVCHCWHLQAYRVYVTHQIRCHITPFVSTPLWPCEEPTTPVLTQKKKSFKVVSVILLAYFNQFSSGFICLTLPSRLSFSSFLLTHFISSLHGFIPWVLHLFTSFYS